MIFEIHTRGFSLTGALAEAIEMRLNAITAGWREQLTRIDVTLSDVNGPKGGVDKVCKIRCMMAGNEPVFVESMAMDMYEAIHASFDKIKRLINKKRKRIVARRHRKGASDDSVLSDFPTVMPEVKAEPFEQNFLLGNQLNRYSPKQFF